MDRPYTEKIPNAVDHSHHLQGIGKPPFITMDHSFPTSTPDVHVVFIGLRPLYGLFCAMRYDSRALWRFWAKRGYGRVVHVCKHA